MAGMRDDVERWLTHGGLSFLEQKSEENVFQIRVRHAGPAGVPVEIFEPEGQPGVLVVGSKVIMRNNQMSRYLRFSDAEKESWEKRVAEYCRSIRAVNRNVTEDGKRKIGVYVVIDSPEDIHQQGLFDAMDMVSEMHEKTARFLLKTF